MWQRESIVVKGMECSVSFAVPFFSDLKDREGMSVSELSTPAMCRGINGEALLSWRRNASARTSCIATFECFAVRRCTQCTIGELSLNSATWALVSEGHTSSITSHSKSNPAISKSEFVMVPFGLLTDQMSAVMSGGHCN